MHRSDNGTKKFRRRNCQNDGSKENGLSTWKKQIIQNFAIQKKKKTIIEKIENLSK